MNALENLPASFTPDLRVNDPLTASWLAETTLRLRREICWLWQQKGNARNAQSDILPPVTDTLSESLDLLRFSDDKKNFFDNDTTARYLSENIQSLRDSRKHDHGPWDAVCHRLALDEEAQFLLALGLLVRIDPASSAVMAACQNDNQKMLPTLALAQRLYEAENGFSRIDVAHPLFRTGLLGFQNELNNAGWHQGYEVSPLVASALVLDDGRVPAGMRLVTDKRIVAHDTPTLEAAASLLQTAPDSAQFVPLLGDVGTDYSEWAAVLCKKTDRLLIEFVEPVLPNSSRLSAIAAWCWLYDADVLLPLMNASSDEHARDRIAWPDTHVRWYVPMHDIQASKQLPAYAVKPAVVLPVTDFEMRVTRFRKALGKHAEALDSEILEFARRFRIGAKAIEAVGLAAAEFDTLDAEQLSQLCRAQVRLDLGTLAQAVTPRFKFNELILPPAQALQMGEIIRAMRSLTWVHYRWGTARAWNDAGLSVMFCGPSGTGKTMAAEAIAEELQLPMFRIDLSQVVNKYIGETEKNLKKVFDAAEESDCVIFFDEADALFGKRTSVKDAHDRFANIEISYLLERMERLKGIAILATNRRKDLDEAFLRRLRFLVEFPLPGEEERARLWRYVFPKGVDIDALDVQYLARSFPLAGGHIRSIAFNACLQTEPGAEPCVGMPQVLSAVKRELDKLNRPNSPESFGSYQNQVIALFEENLR
ncbi:MAG: ATP-binding protein [Arenimonas sp.]